MKKKLKGFTLMEMVVVLTIIGILGGILLPSMIGYVKRARVAVAIADAKTIKTSVEASLMSKFVINKSTYTFPYFLAFLLKRFLAEK